MKAILLLCLAACGGSSFAASTEGDASTTDAMTGDAPTSIDDAAKDGSTGLTESGPADAPSTDAPPVDAGPSGCVAPGTGTLGVLGCPCSAPGSLACTGNAQKVTLICSGGSWAYSQTCMAGQLCDSTPGSNQGTCLPIDPVCVNATPGQNVCGDPTTVAACGADLVSDSPVQACTDAMICIAGACVTPPPCPAYNSATGPTCSVFDGGATSCLCPTGCTCTNVYAGDPQLYCGESGDRLCGQ